MNLVLPLALVALAVLLRDAVGLSRDLGVTLCGWATYALALAAYVAAGVPRIQGWFRRETPGRPHQSAWGLMLGLWAASLLCGWVMGVLTAPGALQSLVFLAGILVLAHLADWRAGPAGHATWADLLLLCWLWVPVASHWIPLWQIPPGMDAATPPHSMVGSAMALPLLAVPLSLLAFTVLRPVPGLTFSWALAPGDVTTAVAAYSSFVLVLGLPIGLLTGLAQPHRPAWPPLEVVASFAMLFFLPAALEEFFFRGVMLHLLASRLPGPHRQWVAMGVCALLFGLVHPARHGYRILATLAGLVYGTVYLRTGRLSVAALTHAAVDFTWIWLFSG